MATFVTNHSKPYEALSSKIASRPLDGKTVFITGAGRGVGAHITQAIAEAGARRVGILGRDKTRIENAKDKLAKDYPSTSFIAYAADISDENAIATAIKDFGVADVLINNAGIFPDDGPFIKQDLREWFKGFEVNVLGTAIVTQKYLQAKAPEAPGIVLNVSSMAAHMRFPLLGWSGYNSSKLGQARVFEALRFEHPEVRFINIHPGEIESDGYTKSGAPTLPSIDGKLAGHFFAWAATDEAAFLKDRFVWAPWDIDELKAKEHEILNDDLLLSPLMGSTEDSRSGSTCSC